MQIEDFKDLTRAEKMLIENCPNGLGTVISEKRPEEGSPANTIRAGLIRALLLGTGERPPRPKGCGSWAHGSLKSWILTVRSCRCRWCYSAAP
ncbi:hypothetical protein [Planktomarina sp.]